MGSSKIWDSRFLALAKLVSTWSKDPSTQTGAVIVDEKNRVVALGFNGFPIGIADDKRLQDRTLKYQIIIHAELNALLFAPFRLNGCTLYTYPFLTCSRCAVTVIQAGIKRVVAPSLPLQLEDRWGDDVKFSKALFKEAGIVVEASGP